MSSTSVDILMINFISCLSFFYANWMSIYFLGRRCSPPRGERNEIGIKVRKEIRTFELVPRNLEEIFVNRIECWWNFSFQFFACQSFQFVALEWGIIFYCSRLPDFPLIDFFGLLFFPLFSSSLLSSSLLLHEKEGKVQSPIHCNSLKVSWVSLVKEREKWSQSQKTTTPRKPKAWNEKEMEEK